MAFTSAQRTQIRKWLCYPQVDRDTYSHLESTLTTVGADPDAQTEVEAILAKLAAIDPKIDASMTTAGLKRAEDIEWYEGASVASSVAHVGRMYCHRLSVIFNIELGGDAFGDGTCLGGPFQLG